MKTRRGHPGDRGAVAVFVAVFVVVFMILLAFVVDRGRVYVTRAQLQNAVDAAAFAAGQDLCWDDGSTDPVQRALTYSESNGVDALDDAGSPTGAVVVTGPQAQGKYQYLNVAAQQDLGFSFGAFVSRDGAGVAAQATVRRLCSSDFRFVSDELTNFNGTGSAADNIYAGKCFEGNGGTYGIVAVWVASTYAGCWSTPGRPPIDFGTDGGGNQGSGTALYSQPPGGVPTVTAQSAATELWPEIPTLDTYTSTEGCGAVSDFTTPNQSDGDTIVCAASGSELRLQAPVSVTHIVADDDISDNGVVWDPATWNDESGSYLIYARAPGTDITISGNYLPKNVTLYAPDGTVAFTGGGATIDGRVFARNITLNGGGADAATGASVPIKGTVELVQ